MSLQYALNQYFNNFAVYNFAVRDRIFGEKIVSRCISYFEKMREFETISCVIFFGVF